MCIYPSCFSITGVTGRNDCHILVRELPPKLLFLRNILSCFNRLSMYLFLPFYANKSVKLFPHSFVYMYTLIVNDASIIRMDS